MRVAYLIYKESSRMGGEIREVIINPAKVESIFTVPDQEDIPIVCIKFVGNDFIEMEGNLQRIAEILDFVIAIKGDMS